MRLERDIWLLALLACGPSGGGDRVAGPLAPRPGAVTRDVPEAAPAADRPRITSRPSPTWNPLRVAPDCEVRVAAAPATLEVPLRWRPCPQGPRGCREVSTALTQDAFGPRVAVTALAHGGEVTVAVQEGLPGRGVRTLLAARDGPPFFAIEGPLGERCALGGVHLSADGAVVEVIFDGQDGYASRAYLRGPLADDPAWRRVAAVLPRREFPDFIGESALSVGGRVAVMASGGPVRWFDSGHGRWTEVPGSQSGLGCCAHATGDAVMFTLESIPERAMVARLGEPARELRPPVRDGGTSSIAVDGSLVVWVEGRGRDRNNYYRELELWRGELSPGLAITDARVVTRLTRRTMVTPLLGGGMVALPLHDDDTELAIVRLATGEMRRLAPPDGLAIEEIHWIAAGEICVRIGQGGRTVMPSTIRRIPIDSLPPAPRP